MAIFVFLMLGFFVVLVFSSFLQWIVIPERIIKEPVKITANEKMHFSLLVGLDKVIKAVTCLWFLLQGI